MTDRLQRFLDAYQNLPETGLDVLDAVYDPAVVFIDPFHQVNGLPALKRYLAATYSNAREVRFVFDTPLAEEGAACVPWVLHFRHPRLRGGAGIEVPGISHLRWRENSAVAGRVCWHRDYYDAGALLYEHVPVLGAAVRWFKRRLQAG